MNIIGYKAFYKRENSTKRPSGNSTTYSNVVLKEGTSIHSPTFILQGIDTNVNYVEWTPDGTYTRYYYVRDIVLQHRDIYEVMCDIDLLATHRTDIGGTYAYIEYASDSMNRYIPDVRQTANPISRLYSNTSASSPFSVGDETYILGIIGSSSDTTPFSNFYAIPEEELASLAELDNNIIAQLISRFSSAAEAIVALYTVPMSMFHFSTGVPRKTVYIGEVNSGATAYPINNVYETFDMSLSLPSDYLTNVTGFRRLQPFTEEIKLYLPFVGYINISPSDIVGDEFVYIKAIVNYTTRDITYYVASRTSSIGVDHPLGVYSGKIGATRPIVGFHDQSMLMDVGMGVGGALATATIAATTKGLSTVAFSAMTAGSITNAMKSLVSNTASQAGGFASGGMEYVAPNTRIYIRYREPIQGVSDYTDTIGQPYCECDNISNHSGYIQCRGASIDCDAYANDRTTINTYLNNGFYYE